mgnify:CR=1 FL=1
MRHKTSSKRSRLLEAAAKLFVLHGYDNTSIEMIADAAQISRQTIYNQFGSKDALFIAIAKELTGDLTASIAHPLDVGHNLARTLETFGRQVLSLVVADRNLAIYRLVLTEVSRFPELSRAVLECGIAVTESQIANYLAAQSGLRLDDPRFAARAFLALIVHPIHMRAQLGKKPSQREIAAHVKAAVALFLRAYGGNATRK